MASTLLAILTALSLSQSTPTAPPNDAQSAPPPAAGRNQDRPARGDRMGQGRRAMLDYMLAGPDQRRELRANRLVEMLDRTYQLDDSQKQTVADEVRRMQREYYAGLGADAVELDKLETQMGDVWRKQAEAAGPARGRRLMRDPEFRSLAERVREIRRAHPFDFERAVTQIESLLPPDQVAQGRERREQFRQRMESARAQRSQRRRPRRSNDDNSAAPTAPKAAVNNAMAPVPVVERPKHPWEVFANDFAARHHLTAAQQASARAIVKDLISRDAAYHAAHAGEFAALAKLEPAAERDARRKQLEAPTDEMFNELKSRLDDLLTTEQRSEP